MTLIEDVHTDVKALRNAERASLSKRYFKTGVGEYAEGDIFYGLTLPQVRSFVPKYKELPLFALEKLLESSIHEERQLSLILLRDRFGKAGAEERKAIYDLYLSHTKWINNWDLVDISAWSIVGAYLDGKGITILKKLAKSDVLWERRIAVLAAGYSIKKKDPRDIFIIAEILLHDTHDLIHKAVGWMLREVGKASGEEVEEKFLKKHATTMPRTMLRYAIERFPEKKRRMYLQWKKESTSTFS